MYTALHPDKVQNLVTMVTPVDFKTPDNLLSAWVQNVDVDLAVDTMGNIPGELLNWTFLSLKPFSLTGQKYVNMVDMLDDPAKVKNFLRMEKWIFDSPDQAGETFREFIKGFYQQNGFITGTATVGDQTVDLKQITCPVLNIYALQDHLVPPDASKALKGLTGSKDYTELAFPGGHIGIYVSGKAQKEVTPAIGNWLNGGGGERLVAAEAFSHLGQVSRAEGDIQRRVDEVHAPRRRQPLFARDFPRGGGHHLHQTNGAGVGGDVGIEYALLADHGVDPLQR
jgi:polyhydroxyalkanoate synthase